MFKRVSASLCFCAAITAGFLFRWSAAQAAITEDQKLVQELDARYQSAVQNNDAATMDRLLAEGFLLVTGTGKRYSKADLLDAARNKQAQYEQQSDSEQSVRVWGNTAVITAKLHAKGIESGSPSITRYGSVTHTFELQVDGNMCLDRPHNRLSRLQTEASVAFSPPT